MKITLKLAVISMLLLLSLSIESQNFDFIQYSNPAVVNSENYKSGNLFQKDFLLYMDILKQSHPAFSPGQKLPLNIDSIVAAGYQWTANCQTISELQIYLQKIATLLNDGHTTIFPNYNMNAIYPFQIFFDKDDVYLRAVNKEFESTLGKKIVKINHSPVLTVINSFKSVISSDNDVYFRDKVKNQMQIFSTWEGNPYLAADSTLALTFADNSTALIKPVNRTQLNIVSVNAQGVTNSPRENTKTPFLYKLLPERNICYLQFNSCSDQSTLRQQFLSSGQTITEQQEQILSQIPRFDTFLNEMFDAIAKNNIKTLVVDVRNNSGGNSRLCELLISWLKPVEALKSETSSIRFSELWEMQYPLLANEYKTGFAQKGVAFEYGKLYESSYLSQFENSDTTSYSKMNEYFQQNEDKNKIFKGKVVFIQNANTYSSAGLLITGVTDNNIGTVIGTKSSYRPCHYGDLLLFTLPNTNIKGFVSHKIFYRPDQEKCNAAYLVPAVEIESSWNDVLNGNDKYWEWILGNYE
ncbi:MAG: hypothetical protein LBS25_05310 [Candidatus Symbiothrix sp.]|jgi:hypothetical protein|nr:hypothetical protein [Candidatus Symbiothrix sp.]